MIKLFLCSNPPAALMACTALHILLLSPAFTVISCTGHFAASQTHHAMLKTQGLCPGFLCLEFPSLRYPLVPPLYLLLNCPVTLFKITIMSQLCIHSLFSVFPPKLVPSIFHLVSCLSPLAPLSSLRAGNFVYFVHCCFPAPGIISSHIIEAHY